MSREIKFRGKRVDNGEWVYGWYREMVDSHQNIYPVMYEDNISIAPLKVIPETVGEFTDLKDKNGVEVWEGDIIKRRIGETETVAVVVRSIRYSAFMWFIKRYYPVTKDSHGDFLDSTTIASNIGFTVIGNIHENKDLLNG